MRIAIVTVTENAHVLAIQIADKLRKDPTIFQVDIFKKDVKKTLNRIFNKYDCIIGITATGIMVRIICSLIKNKIEDPAVLVVDEIGNHVISLLSGHYGNANELSKKVGEIIGAKPVITTATDLYRKIGIDTLARKYYLEMDDPKKAKIINTALLEDKIVKFSVPLRFEFIFNDPLVRDSYKKILSHNGNLEVTFENTKIILKPKRVVIGLGTKKDISKDLVIEAIEFAMNTLKLPVDRTNVIATGEIKKNEVGIIDASGELGIPLEIIPLGLLRNFENLQCSESKLVRETFDIPGVCEPSALIAAGWNSKIILKKTTRNGVAVAVAVGDKF